MANQLSQDLGRILEEKFPKDIVEKFRQRMVDDKLTKQENPQSHFCVYFAACDFDSKQVFMGHHIKSGLWLF
ncbi:hypothetical protein HGA64_05055, partial [Candidatus Falkowbacteria bacterium]|nr:hypothetical protein [Candidatus Falkowbacteria bacterium]